MALPPPAEPLRCREQDCTLPLLGRCLHLDEHPDPLRTCPHLLRAERDDGPSVEADRSQPGGGAVPMSMLATPPGPGIAWSGRHLRWGEIGALLRQGPARVLAVLGFTRAGKTSLLTSLFLQLPEGPRRGFPYRFASCLTFDSFRTLAVHATREAGEGPRVPHTPRQGGPGAGLLLHLGLRPADPRQDRHLDVLLSDVAGEHLMEWAEHDSDETRRPLAFLDFSQAALVLVDGPELLSDKGPQTAADTNLLLRRLLEYARKQQGATLQSVALVLTKCDALPPGLQVPTDAAERLRGEGWDERIAGPMRRLLGALRRFAEEGRSVSVHLTSAFPDLQQEQTSYGVFPPFAEALGHVDRRVCLPIERTIPTGPVHPFLTLRRSGAQP